MKNLVIILIVIFLLTCLGFAQDSGEPNTVLIVKRALAYNESNSPAEADSIYALWNKNVVKKNKLINMQMRVQHFYGSNSMDFLTITEYNGSGLNIILDASKENVRIFKEWMPDKENRAALNALFNKYFEVGHSDEIYTLFTKVQN